MTKLILSDGLHRVATDCRTGLVKQNIEFAKMVNRAIHHLLNLLLVHHVGFNREASFTKLLSNGAALACRTLGNHYWHPWATNNSAVDLLMPLVPPVITATLPFNRWGTI